MGLSVGSGVGSPTATVGVAVGWNVGEAVGSVGAGVGHPGFHVGAKLGAGVGFLVGLGAYTTHGTSHHPLQAIHTNRIHDNSMFRRCLTKWGPHSPSNTNFRDKIANGVLAIARSTHGDSPAPLSR